jgi:nitrate reductase gamma subunit
MSRHQLACMRSWFGDAVLLAFLLAQVADGALTYVGVTTFGTHIEANPLVAWYIAACGAGLALLGAKTVAAACAAALHIRAMHRTLGLLTIVYLAMAVWPWTQMLWP